VTTEARALRTPAATQARSRARLLFLLCTVLPVAPAMAAPEPAPVEPEPLAPATILEVPAPVPQAVPATAAVPAAAAAPQAGGLRGKADAAASATLAVLLPHLSRNDGMLLDRSANFAGDVNRLLNQFEQTQKVMKQFSKGGLQKMMRGMKGMLPGMPR